MASAAHDALWAALQALPQPVTRAAALECAKGVLDAKALAGFRAWSEANEAYLLGRLNG